MQLEIKCNICGKRTRNFELGIVFYCFSTETFLAYTRDAIICPKCNQNISDRNCLVKGNYLGLSALTAKVCVSARVDLPAHLQNGILFDKKDLPHIRSLCHGQLCVVDRF